jgi:hypothetical protein
VGLKAIESFVGRLGLEDRIVFLRFLTGLVYGVAVFTASRFVHPVRLTPYAWSASVMVYYFTVLYVLAKYRPTSRFHLYLRGLATFYATWILTVIVLFELTKLIGV